MRRSYPAHSFSRRRTSGPYRSTSWGDRRKTSGDPAPSVLASPRNGITTFGSHYPRRARPNYSGGHAGTETEAILGAEAELKEIYRRIIDAISRGDQATLES